MHWLEVTYRELVLDPGKQPLLLFLGFIAAFLFIRLSVRMIRAGVSWWPGNINRGGLHIHHAVFGVGLMTVAGVASLAPLSSTLFWRTVLAAGFGVGARLRTRHLSRGGPQDLGAQPATVAGPEVGVSFLDARPAAKEPAHQLSMSFHRRHGDIAARSAPLLSRRVSAIEPEHLHDRRVVDSETRPAGQPAADHPRRS